MRTLTRAELTAALAARQMLLRRERVNVRVAELDGRDEVAIAELEEAVA